MEAPAEQAGSLAPPVVMAPRSHPDQTISGPVISEPAPGNVSGDTPYASPDHPYEDTDVDGDVSLNSEGHFLPDRRALQLFDYFYIESGRLDEADIQQQIRDWLASRLQEPAFSEALAFLDQYLNLRQQASSAFAAGDMPTDPMERLQLIRKLQEQAFGVDLANQLYGDEHALHVARVERMKALARGEEADPLQGLSAAESRSYQRTQSVLAVPAMTEQTEDAEQLWQQRSDSYGYDAAYRLAELDQRRAIWNSRVAGFSKELEALDADTSLNVREREEHRANLLTLRFSPSEQLRVQAILKLPAEQGAQ